MVRKSELVNHIKNDVNPDDPRKVVDSVIQRLVQQKLITPLYASESTFAITQTGMKELE